MPEDLVFYTTLEDLHRMDFYQLTKLAYDLGLPTEAIDTKEDAIRALLVNRIG